MSIHKIQSEVIDIHVSTLLQTGITLTLFERVARAVIV